MLESSGGGSETKEVNAGLAAARIALKNAKRKDYYKILDVARDCDEDELKKA